MNFEQDCLRYAMLWYTCLIVGVGCLVRAFFLYRKIRRKRLAEALQFRILLITNRVEGSIFL